MSEWEFEDAEREAILTRRILPLYFRDTPPSDKPPTLVLLAGQPGAGRSRATGSLIADHGADLAVVSGDDLRAFHPRLPDLVSARSPEAVEGIVRATAGWLRDCIRYARENQRSLLLEGAFQDPTVAVATAERFATAGFQTRIVVVASRRAESLLTVASRYLRDVHDSAPARLVSRDVHDRALEATGELVSAAVAAASVSRLTILGRAGEVVFDAQRGRVDEPLHEARVALEAAQSARLSRFDATQWLSELHHMTEFAASRRDLPRGVTELLVELHEIALREVIPELHVPSDGKFTIAIEQKTVARLVELRRSLPREHAVDVAAPVVAPVGPERGGISR
ncbi:zeta toxin family protein [Microbacterium thalli]|uniref:UDP-N-acetylglucosamine kinase n=1 Tax=Microbacterium thalli TaxID=3027921 RepID=A0ABT5SF00_9MICO|nr:zeta toxin family protein [Microbacterium thalli]MDD7961393.1 zeta toxin family protein [Microbacterium thalli]